MKTTLYGYDAYHKIVSAPLPDKTETYTPIAHTNVIKKIKEEISSAGYLITGEEYRCSHDGQIALGQLRLQYKPNPEIELAVMFLNSYNKQYAFRFQLGGFIKESKVNMILPQNTALGSYKRVHKGDADILAEGKISEFLQNSDDYWAKLEKEYKFLKTVKLNDYTTPEFSQLIGDIFLHTDLLDTRQMNMLKKKITENLKSVPVVPTAMYYYELVAEVLTVSHPSTFMQKQMSFHSFFFHHIKEKIYIKGAQRVIEVKKAEEEALIPVENVHEKVEKETVTSNTDLIPKRNVISANESIIGE